MSDRTCRRVRVALFCDDHPGDLQTAVNAFLARFDGPEAGTRSPTKGVGDVAVAYHGDGYMTVVVKHYELVPCAEGDE